MLFMWLRRHLGLRSSHVWLHSFNPSAGAPVRLKVLPPFPALPQSAVGCGWMQARSLMVYAAAIDGSGFVFEAS